MTAIECPVPGTYLVRDETKPIPVGKTSTDVSVVVHRYAFGWVCEECGCVTGTTRSECEHVKAAKEAPYEPVE